MYSLGLVREAFHGLFMSGKFYASVAAPVGGAAGTAAPRLKPVSVPAYLAGTGAGIVLLLALFEPLTSGGLNLPGRLIFFALHFGPALVLAWMLSGWIFGQRATRQVPPWVLLAAVGFVTGFVLAPWSVMLESLFGVVELDEAPAAAAVSAGSAFLVELRDDLFAVPPQAAAIWLAINLAIAWRLHVNTGRPEDAATPAAALAADASTPSSSLFARIPARYGREVIYLEAQEHYLRVVLVGGVQLLLHGLANAVRELESGGVTGMQVHRSYWVNWAHVQSIVIDSSGGMCELDGGVRIPISRRRRAAAKAAFDAYPGPSGAGAHTMLPKSRGADPHYSENASSSPSA